MWTLNKWTYYWFVKNTKNEKNLFLGDPKEEKTMILTGSPD